jgi:hypothetical protein
MKSGWYELESGRQVWLQQLLIRRSFLGIWMGNKDVIRQEVLARLPDEARQLCGENTGVGVQVPPEALPTYVFIAEFLSTTPVRQEFDCSGLAVCWFSDSLAVEPELVGKQVRSVDWEANAQDGYY